MKSLNKSAVIVILFCLILTLVRQHNRAPAPTSGQVENQIRAFGHSIASRLNSNSSFEQVGQPVTGYRPLAEIPHAPAGLKPAEQKAWEAMAARITVADRTQALAPVFPEHYAQGTEVHGQGMTIILQPIGSTSASACIENGKLVYHNAYPETDSLLTATPGHSEEFLLLRNAAAPIRFEYQITSASGVKDVTLHGNAIHFKNTKGEELQLEAPWLVETAPARSSDQLSLKAHVNGVHWELTTAAKSLPHLALVIDNPKSLHYPVLIDPSWTSTLGQLNTARYNHTATLLNNGQVLVAGGYNYNSGVLGSAELYHPSTGTWTITGSLHIPRQSHSATLLANGEVLVVGGYDSSANVASTELYNPITGTWTVSGILNVPRTGQTATVLPNGYVLIVGGSGSTGTLASAELFSPASGQWTLTGNMKTAREFHTATLLPNGQVLIAGGGMVGYSSCLTTCEIYNPATGKWTDTGALNVSREYHTATLLPNGMVLAVAGLEYSFLQGGGDGGIKKPITDDPTSPTIYHVVSASAEFYNPSTGTWTVTGSIASLRENQSATLLPNGQVLIAGGDTGFSSDVLNTTEVYSPATGSWSDGTDLQTARNGHTATLLANGQILIAGGLDGNPLSETELYDGSAGTSTATGSLNVLGYFRTATLLPNGKVLVVGGQGTDATFADAELYDSASGTWTTTGSLHTGRSVHTATLLPNGQVLVAGGDNGSVLTSAEIYNPTTGTWSVTGSLHFARYFQTATLLSNGKVLVAGGDGSGVVYGEVGSTEEEGSVSLSSAEIYDPATGTWSVTGSLTMARGGQSAILLPNGQVLVAGGGPTTISNPDSSAELYDPVAGTWAATGNLNTARETQTATLLPSGQVLVAGGYDGSASLATCELYNPTTGLWTTTGSMNTVRYADTATLLSNGQVLIAGGFNGSAYLNTTEIYDPETGTWALSGNLITARANHSAALLPSGKILIAAGDYPGTPSSCELFNPGLGYSAATQPMVNAVEEGVVPEGMALSLTGTGFTGMATDLTGTNPHGGPSEASSGGTQSSPSNVPVVQLESLANEQIVTLSVDPAAGFNATSFTSQPLTGLTPGYALLTMFVNGTPSQSQIINVTAGSQTISFPTIPTQTYGVPLLLNATASSGLPVTYTANGPVALSANGTATFTGVGTVQIRAHQNGSTSYLAAPSVLQTFTVAKANQTIPAESLGSLPYTSSPITIPTLTSSAGLPVTITVVSGPATINGTQGMLTGTGSVTLAANQPGNADYNAAPQITVTFTVTKASQTITFNPITNKPYGYGPFHVAATSSSGLATTFHVVSGPATISGNLVTLTGPSSQVVLGADQAGNADYNAAPEATQSFTVKPPTSSRHALPVAGLSTAY